MGKLKDQIEGLKNAQVIDSSETYKTAIDNAIETMKKMSNVIKKYKAQIEELEKKNPVKESTSEEHPGEKTFKITQDCEYLMGHLRYGHYEATIHADSIEEVAEMIKDYPRDFMDLEIDDVECEEVYVGDNPVYITEEGKSPILLNDVIIDLKESNDHER